MQASSVSICDFDAETACHKFETHILELALPFLFLFAFVSNQVAFVLTSSGCTNVVAPLSALRRLLRLVVGSDRLPVHSRYNSNRFPIPIHRRISAFCFPTPILRRISAFFRRPILLRCPTLLRRSTSWLNRLWQVLCICRCPTSYFAMVPSQPKRAVDLDSDCLLYFVRCEMRVHNPRSSGD